MGPAGRADRTGGVGTLFQHIFPLEGITEQRDPRGLEQGAGARAGLGTPGISHPNGAECFSFSTFAKLEFALWPKYPRQHQYSIRLPGLLHPPVLFGRAAVSQTEQQDAFHLPSVLSSFK